MYTIVVVAIDMWFKQNKRIQREQNKIYYKERKFLSRNLVIYYLYKLSLLVFFYSNHNSRFKNIFLIWNMFDILNILPEDTTR